MGLSQLLIEGFRLHQSGQLVRAEEIYLQILKQGDNRFNALQLLGALALQQGDYQNALHYLNAALDLNPHYALLLYNLGLVTEKLNQFPQALDYYKRAITLDPSYHNALSNKQALEQRIAAAAAFQEVKNQLKSIQNDPQSPFLRDTQSGYKRGIDYYSQEDLLATMTNVFYQYHGYFKVYPNLVNPQNLNEKIQWIKFFAPIKFPQSGNKLSTSFFIPAHLKSELHTPKVIWHSRFERLPSNQLIPPGYYYLKSNFGSGMFKKIHYPLSKGEREDLESMCSAWLGQSFGLQDGEWWYNTFTKNIFLEEEIVDLNGPISYNFHVAHGAILYINLFNKPALGSGEVPSDTRYDHNFKELPEGDQHPGCSRILIHSLSDVSKEKMMKYAQSIGKQFPYVRVDFLMNQEQEIYLGEITHSPTNGFESRSKFLEQFAGEQIVLQ